jgi:hypothetical protein
MESATILERAHEHIVRSLQIAPPKFCIDRLIAANQNDIKDRLGQPD